MDFWYIHYIGVCIIYILILIYSYFIIILYHQQVVAFPLPGMQEITAHGSIVRRDQSDAQNRINVWESQGLIFAASNNVGLFRHWVTVVRSKVDAWCKCMEFSMDLLETCSEVHHLGGKLQGPCFTSWELWGARVGMLYFCWCFRLFYNILLFFFWNFWNQKKHIHPKQPPQPERPSVLWVNPLRCWENPIHVVSCGTLTLWRWRRRCCPARPGKSSISKTAV